ncbi:MAG TPA: carbamoyltransferase HypF [Actinomycetota bacterium]|nr:carbamoyltransferase HypF [Actinomycetota bacterium]
MDVRAPDRIDRPLARDLEVRGIVQGVGFRPFVWRLATRHGIAGWVRNRSGIVEIHAEGSERALEAFCAAIAAEAPPLARVEDVRWSPASVLDLAGFEVDRSLSEAGGDRMVSPDVATCAACLTELFDPKDRRYRYPFINCTDCGPRFTIIERLPYDRERTSMRVFPLCDDCRREYLDPSNRRFHAEPVACPVCGPRVELRDAGWRPLDGDPIAEAASLLRRGMIVAVKGLGGFHLACDATNDRAVHALRVRKARPDKPFAVMVADVEQARELFELAPDEVALLGSPSAPIVLVPDLGRLAPSVAPGHRRQGAMLPSTPLHHLLLGEAQIPLVMTSGNRSDEPICTGNDEARERLSGIADAFLVHDREIVARYDDSVARVWRSGPVVIRRARSFAPSPIELPVEVRPTLGAGAMLNGTFCLASGTRAFLSQHIGDLDTEEAMRAYADALDRYRCVFALEPEVVAHDLHPDFATTRFAEETGLPRVAVQHHHAHVAAVMAEHRLGGPVIGVAFDGFGLGDDGTIWGGEFLACDWGRAERLGHLRAVRQPGGDAAVRQPWRMALAHAADAGCLAEARSLMPERGDDSAVVLGQIRSGLASPLTSSMGRLFDAVSALARVCREATYEGQPAMLLEQAAEPEDANAYPVRLDLLDGRLIVDSRPIVAGVVRDLLEGVPAGRVSARFHHSVAEAIELVCARIRSSTGLDRVCLGGGVFQNALLVDETVGRLEALGFSVFVPRQVPAGDGGIALGQVLVAHARMGGEG